MFHVCYNCSVATKRAKRRDLPTFYSSHSVHLLNKLNTRRRRTNYHSQSVDISSLERDLQHSLELDKTVFIQSFRSYTPNDCFKFLRTVNKNPAIPQFVSWVNATAGDDLSKAQLFNNYFISVFDSASPRIVPCALPDSHIRLDDVFISVGDVCLELSSL